MERPDRRAWLPLATLAATLTLTLIASVVAAQVTNAREHARFDRRIERAMLMLDRHLQTYVALLRSTAGFVAATEVPGRESFMRYVDQIDLDEHYPGMQGIGLSLVIRDDPSAFAERWRARGLEGFHVWPEGPRDEMTAIVHLSPLDRRNQAAVGYDMWSEPRRRAAMARARDDAAPAASARITLVQEIDPDKQAGLLVYLPVYRTGPRPPTVEARRETLIGYVYSPFRADDLLRAVLADERTPLIDLAVYDGLEPDPEALLFSEEEQRPLVSGQRRLSDLRRIDVFGRPWTLAFHANAVFYRTARGGLVPGVALVGLLFSVVLFLATRAQSRARAAAERIAGELSRSEAGLREARDAAELANRMKDDFLATVSHELRTPLTAMLGWTQLLRAGRIPPEEQREALAVVERNAQAQARIVEDLLDVSRILRGRIALEVKRIDLADAIAAAGATLAPIAEAKGVAVDTRVERGVGLIEGDPARIQQIVWNLLSNAVKFTDPGGRVTVRVVPRDHEVDVEVSDTGIGISPEFLPHVFDRFRQADPSATRQLGGLGLGLGIVQHLAALHGGTARAESAGAGRGATFTVTLPVRHAAGVAPTEATDEIGPAPAEGRPLEGVVVLVVDDEADARALLARVLSGVGARVHTAGSGADGFELLQRLRPDVLVSDIAMPVEDGWALLRRVRGLPPEQGGRVRAIALTAYARPEDRTRSAEAGFEEHLTKPIDPDELIAVVQRLAGRG